ncbi:MAG TPA: hypothetical protein IAB70_02315 [Candidatus Merdicola faecigallinarum]|uniref:Uncharacterized protein n=1 Tax=Candidatus Merdicola faecigallinarum TaxID=2840862 RepID=A0A9D1M091_9FIRM|nr:hypothetical protein [Candidatus Merdicola faecigallinarum]
MKKEKKIKTEKIKKEKVKKGSKSEVFVKVMAGILAALMIFSVGGTLLYYVVAM